VQRFQQNIARGSVVVPKLSQTNDQQRGITNEVTQVVESDDLISDLLRTIGIPKITEINPQEHFICDHLEREPYVIVVLSAHSPTQMWRNLIPRALDEQVVDSAIPNNRAGRGI
jgi:hypothetical protein